MAATPQPADEPRAPLHMGPRGKMVAGDAVWRWRYDDAATAVTVVGAIKKRAALRSTVGCVAAVILFAMGHPALALVVSVVATGTFLLAQRSPLHAFAAFERGLASLSSGVGLIVAWLVLMPVFLLFFIPFGVLFRRGDNDPLRRRLCADTDSYWRERKPEDAVLERRKRQF